MTGPIQSWGCAAQCSQELFSSFAGHALMLKKGKEKVLELCEPMWWEVQCHGMHVYVTTQ